VNIPSAQKAEFHNPPSSYEPPVAATYGRRRPFDKDFIIEQIDESMKSANFEFTSKVMDWAHVTVISTAMSYDVEKLLRRGDGSVSDPSFSDLKEYINTVLLRFSECKGPFYKDFVEKQIDESIKSANLVFNPKFMDMARNVIIVKTRWGDDETLLRSGDGSVSDPSFSDLKEYINTVLLRFSQLKE
jgi:hypothetical protein